MHSIRIAAGELRLLGRSRKMRIAAFGILIIPLLYGALYLWAFWDPYARLDRIPVALVNEDRPVRVDGETLAAGRDLTDELVDTDTLEWHVVSRTAAETGIENGTYYLVLRIPSDFSESLATAENDNPVPARLVLVTHEASGMIANQIGDRVVSEVRAAASASASRGYYDNIFIGFDDLSTKLTKAADGASELHDGLTDARSGATRLAVGTRSADTGAGELAKGTAKLAAGASALDDGASKLARGTGALATGLETASSGSSALASGARAAAAGADDLAQGVSQVSGGAEKLDESAEALAKGAHALSSGIDAAAPQLAEATSGAKSVAAGSSAVVSSLKAYAADHPEAADDPAFAQAMGAAGQVKDGAALLSDGLSRASDDFGALAKGAAALSAGASQLADGASSLAGATRKATAGARTLADGTGELAAGSGRLAGGIGAAASGAQTLKGGTGELASGAHRLDKGLSAVASGAKELHGGIGKISAGTAALAVGLKPAVSGSAELADGLTAGVADVPAYTAAQRNAHAAVMSDPVELSKKRVDSVPNYGTGFAPYFIPLSLWIGALATFFIVRPVPPKAIERNLPAPIAALAGLWPAALLAVAQSVVLLIVLHTSLGLEVRSLPLMFAFCALTSIVFVAILQWLSATFGLPGKFIAIVLLMLQLTSAAGTYPLETLPTFFRTISPWLPMTYVVAGLRQIISGGDWAALAFDTRRLLVFGVVAVALMSVTAWRARSWPADRLNALPEV